MVEFSIFGKKVNLSWADEQQSKVYNTVKQQVTNKQSYKKGLSLVNCRKIMEKEPMMRKASKKKNKDTFRNWFKIVPNDDTDKVDKEVLDIFREFNDRSRFHYKLFQGGFCADIYGTGYIEIVFKEGKNVSVSAKPSGEPIGLVMLNSEHMKTREYGEGDIDHKGALFWVYTENPSNKIFIHPDRIIDVATDRTPDSYFGVAKPNLLYNILTSKINSDISLGEILNWFGHGILDTTIEDMNKEQEKQMIALYDKGTNAYVHDEKYKIDVHNPSQIDPKNFITALYMNISAAFEMPLHILTGESVGNVTGSEVGVSDYYHDIENNQKIIYTPIVRNIYKRILEARGKKWKYNIVWNPIFVDEMSEAKILQSRTWSASNAYNAGYIDISEARKITNEGVVKLDINKKIEKPKPVVAPTNPNVDPQPAVKKPVKNVSFLVPLNEEQKRMIKAVVDREKKLGEEVLAEQDRLFEEREKRDKRKK